MDVRHIRISDYDYLLPDGRIAKFPLAQRDRSKLLVYRGGVLSEDVFSELPRYLPMDALMVFNNTRVIQARLHFRKETGALIEVFLLEPVAPADYEQMFQTRDSCAWLCLVGNQKKWKEGELCREVRVGDVNVRLCAVKESDEGGVRVRFEWDCRDVTFAELLDAAGELPIPPYLNRKTEERDKTTYQTVYSKIKGSVAAPTAGLHFTQSVLERLDKGGFERAEVTLHVGAGTFKPVKSTEIEGHEMHTEYVSVRRSVLDGILRHDCRCIAVGTTSVRTLESLYYMGCRVSADASLAEHDLHIAQWEPYDRPGVLSPREAIAALAAYMDRRGLDVLHSSTQIMIVPGYEYKLVKALVTNFHQPQSTLLLLVSAFVNGDWRRIYDYALSHDFRFLSYGDSSLLIP